MGNETKIIEQEFAKIPQNMGDYDELVQQGVTSFGVKERVNRYGCEFESIVENNTYAPATLVNRVVTPDTAHWRLVTGIPGNYGLDGKFAEMREELDTEKEKTAALEEAVGTGGSVDERIAAEATARENAVSAETTRAQAAEENLRQLYNNLSQSQPIPVTSLPATGEAGKIYRLAGTTSYADYMYAEGALTTPIKMAEYDNAIDDEPTVGSENLVKSGGVKESFNEVYEKLQKRNIDRNEFTEYTTSYNFSSSGMAIYPIGGLYCTMPIKAGSIIKIVYGENMINTTCCCLLNIPHPVIQYADRVIDKGWIAAGEASDVLQATGPNKTLILKAIENCWLYIVPNSDYSYWPISLTIKEEDNVYDDLNNKIIGCDERITTLEGKEAALPIKTTISSIIAQDVWDQPKTQNVSINIYGAIRWNTQSIRFENKNYRVIVKIKVISDVEGSYILKCNHNTQMPESGSLISPTLEYNKIYCIDFGEYIDKGTNNGIFIIDVTNPRWNDGKGATELRNLSATLYGFYIIDADTFDYVEGFENLLDYDKQETVIFTNAMKAAHSSTSDSATESNHSAESDLSSETNRVRTAYEGKLVGLYGDSLVTYTSGFYRKYFKPLGMTPSLVGNGGGQVNNRGKYGFCTLERLALLPKNMKVLCFWGGANDGNYYVDRTQPDWIDNAKFGTIDDKPLGVADMFNYHLTVENMDDPDTPGITQTFFQAYKTLLRNISLLFPHTLLVCVTQYRSYYYDWTQGKDTVIHKKNYPRLIAAEKACCEEYSVPVCDLYTKAGVNDSNCFTMLNDDGGSLIHPWDWFGERCVNLIAQTVKENMFLVEPTNAWTYNLRNDDKDVRELKEYLVDLRSETETNYMTLEEAIQGFISYTTEKSITLKNNMYLVFYNNQYGNSVGYFLVDYTNPSSVDSWQQWVNATVYDMRQRDVTLGIDYGVQTLSEAIASFTHKATVEQWTYNNNMYMYFLTDDNGSWSMYRLSTPSAPSSTSSWTFVKNGQN